MKCTAIIPSGGVGSRFKSPIPKQYVKVLGKELIAYTLEVFQKCKLVDNIIIAANESYFQLLNQIKEEYSISKITKVVEGGLERQDSVYNGLCSSKFEDDEIIIIHDAARPLLSLEILENAIYSAVKYDSIVVAISARDTLFEKHGNKFNYLDRSNIYYAQTPQIFKYRILKDSFSKAIDSNFKGTDESMLVQNADYEIKVVSGEYQNIKITTESDMRVFEKIVK